MRKFFYVLLFFFSFALILSAQDYSVNLKNIELKNFVKFVSEFTNTNIVYKENELRGKITIDTKTELTKDDVMKIFYSVLRVNNLEAIKHKNFIEIMRKAYVRTVNDKFRKNVRDGERMVTTVLKVNTVDVMRVKGVFNKFKSYVGLVDAIKNINVLVVRDFANRIAKMRKILAELESINSNYIIDAMIIKNAKASSVARNITKFFSSLKRTDKIAVQPVIISDDFSNTIIAAATKDEFKTIRYLIEKTDVEDTFGNFTPKVYYLKNATASDVEKVLNRVLSSVRTVKGKARIIRPKVSSDKATNAIIVIGDKDVYKKAESLISKLDIPRKQVYVEALILETTLEKGSQFGVEWYAGGGNKNLAGAATFQTTGALASLQGSVIDGNTPNFGSLPGGFNLGILGDVITYEGIKFPTLGMLVNFLRTASGINILSNPQILTLDNEEAEVFVGENRPYLVSTKYDANNNPVQNFDYRDVGVKLKITPHISNDNTITLNVYTEVKKLSSAVATTTTAPITLTRQTKTKVKLKNNSTMVISGLIKDDSNSTNKAVPFFSSIPIIGELFKSRDEQSQKTNMMVFISVHTISSFKEAEELTKKKKAYSEQYRKNIEKLKKRDF